MTESYERAKSILKTHAKEHKALAEALLKYETLDADDIKSILTGDKKTDVNANWKPNKSTLLDHIWQYQLQRKEKTKNTFKNSSFIEE